MTTQDPTPPIEVFDLAIERLFTSSDVGEFKFPWAISANDPMNISKVHPPQCEKLDLGGDRSHHWNMSQQPAKK